MKADRLQELSELMHRSITKIEKIRTKQESELNDYAEKEDAEIKYRKDRLKADEKRIEEDKKSYSGEKEEVDAKM